MSWITKRKKRGRTEWLFVWPDPVTGKDRVKVMKYEDGSYVTGKREALSLKPQFDEDLAKQREQAGAWTLETAKEKVLEAFGSRYSPGYKKNLDIYWGAVHERFGKDLVISDKNLSPVEVASFASWLRETRKLKNSSIQHYVNALSKGLGLAVEKGFLSRNPCTATTVKEALPDDTGKRERILTEEECRRLLKHCADHLRTFVVLALATGARHGEILSLEWEDLDSEELTIRFEHAPEKGKRTKNKKTLWVAVSAECMEYVQKHHKRVEGSQWVFPMAGDPTRHMLSVKHSFSTAAKAAGLGGITPHVLRHTVASHLAKGKFSPTTRRDHLRHSDYRMTDLYSHSFSEEQREAAESLGNLLSEAKPLPKALPEDEIVASIERILGNRDFVSLMDQGILEWSGRRGSNPRPSAWKATLVKRVKERKVG